jgi:hypothetical protein
VGDLDPIDIDVNIDRLLHAATSCVGNVVLAFNAGQLATMGFSWRGVISGVGTEADGTAFTVGSTPVPCKSYGLSVTVAGVTAPKTGLIVPSLVFDCGNILDPRDDINGAEGYSPPIITGRNPIISMVTEAPAIATIDWEDVYQDHTSLDFAFSHNDGGGIRQELNVSFTAFLSAFPVLGEMNGKMVYTLQLQPSVTTGATPLTLSWSAT